MNCPSCDNTLTSQNEAGIQAQVCAGGCGGLWLEGRQVKKVRDRLPGAGVHLLDIPRAEGVHVFRDVQHVCPHCRTTLLYRHCFDRQLELEIDQCAKCAGFWLETGPLPDIVSLGKSSADRARNAGQFFHVLIDEKVANMNFVNHDTLEAAQQIVLIFRFLTPPDLFPQTLPLELS